MKTSQGNDEVVEIPLRERSEVLEASKPCIENVTAPYKLYCKLSLMSWVDDELHGFWSANIAGACAAIAAYNFIYKTMITAGPSITGYCSGDTLMEVTCR